jgi:hypothetical protein
MSKSKATSKSKAVFSPPPAATLEPLRLTVRQAAQKIGMSRAQLYRRLQAGELLAQKDGASVYILPDELRRYVATRTGMYQPMETRARKRAAAGAAR